MRYLKPLNPWSEPQFIVEDRSFTVTSLKKAMLAALDGKPNEWYMKFDELTITSILETLSLITEIAEDREAAETKRK